MQSRASDPALGGNPTSGENAAPMEEAGTSAHGPAVLRAEVEEAKRVVGRGSNGALTRHWADVLAVIAAGAVVPRVAYLLMADPGKPPLVPHAAADLPAFTVLQPRHLAKLDGEADAARAKLLGRYLARPVRARSPIDSASLGPASLTAALLAGRHVLPLQLPAGAAPDSLRAGAIADLLLSPAAPAPGASPVFVQRVPVLAVAPAGEGMRVVLAVDRAQLDSLAPRVGTSRVYVLMGGDARMPPARQDAARKPRDGTAAPVGG